MSQINVNNIRAKDGVSAVGFPGGINATGVVTATTFSGNLTGNVTGNVTGNTSGTAGGLTGTPNITVGTVTGTDATFSGNLTVNGTTTTIDTAVTAVDSLAVDGLTTSGGFQATGNTTPSTGSGVEVFQPTATEGRIQTYNRGSTAWMDLRLKGQSITLSNDSVDVLSIDANRTTKFKGPLTEKARYEGVTLNGDYNHDLITHGNVAWLDTAAGGAFALNLRGSATVALNDMMDTGESLSFWFAHACASNTAYYMNAFKVDGTTISGTDILWSGGSAPTSAGGGTGTKDVYAFTVFKTANATFRAFASLSNHA